MLDTTSFDGLPVAVTLTLAGDPGNVYVSSFSESWSDLTYSSPFITSGSGTGFPTTPDGVYDNEFGFYSTVNLSDSGGSIFIAPTPGYTIDTDTEPTFNLDYTFSTVRNPYSSFVDKDITGTGSADSTLDFVFSEQFGYAYDASSTVKFTLSSLSQSGGVVPEPATWVMMLLGFAGLGVAIRSHRLPAA
jgi:hypothetical protein